MSKHDHPLRLLIRKLETHARLEEDDCQAILALPFTTKISEPQSYIVREGEPPLHCAVLLSGFAYRHKLTGDGARQIVSLHIPGEALDFQNIFLDVADHNVQALSRCKLAYIPRPAFQRLVRARPAIAHAILITILVEAAIFREWVLNVGRRDAKARIAHVLCEFAIRLDAQGLAEEYGYELPMSQEQLADALGLTPVHVNRTLKVLEAEGLILRQNRQVSFPDWQRLREVGDFDPLYLHLQQQQS